MERFAIIPCSGGCGARFMVNRFSTIRDGDEWTCSDCLRFAQITAPLKKATFHDTHDHAH